MEVEVERTVAPRSVSSPFNARFQQSIRLVQHLGSTRPADSVKLDRFGKTFNPANTAIPGSRISDIRCGERPIPQSFSANSGRMRWVAGSILLAGCPLSATMRSRLSQMRSGTNKNKPPDSVRNEWSLRRNFQTSAVAAIIGFRALSRLPGERRRSLGIPCFCRVRCTIVVPVGHPSSVSF